MAINRDIENIIDKYSVPAFDPSLQDQLQISSAPNLLADYNPLDVIEIELLDQYSNRIRTHKGHIQDISGIGIENSQLKIDAFEIVTNLFNITKGRYTIQVSGYRNYIYQELGTDEDGNLITIENANPGQLDFKKLEIVEFSKTRTEVRLKAANDSFGSFVDFFENQTPQTIPQEGFYWKFDDNAAVYYALNKDGYNTTVNKRFATPEEYAEHRAERGLPGIDENGNYQWSGIRLVDGDFNLLGYLKPEGGGVDVKDPDKPESNTDIWPIYLRATRPDGNTLNLISTNWVHHEYTPKPDTEANPNEQPEPIDTVIFKLVTKAAGSIPAGANLDLLRPLFIPFQVPVEIDIPYIIEEAFTELRGPNLRIKANKNSGKPTLLKNEDQLTGTNKDVKSRIDNKVISGSGLIEINTDFSQRKNFIHFSSAVERLKNFRYKIQQIESYDSQSLAFSTGFSGTDSSVTGSETVVANKLSFDIKKREMIRSFTPYEEYLYYEKHDDEVVYGNDGPETIHSATWPKTDAERTGLGYTLYHSTSSEAISWYNSQLISASAYDAQNVSYLRNTIPVHIRTNEDNDEYQLFLDMIGEHFDRTYLTIKSLEDTYQQHESVDKGLSKDILLDVAKSFGFNLYPGFSSSDLWDYVLGTDDSGTYQASGSGETKTFVKKDSHSSGDIEKQTWKRIINNLPLLLKTKGTARGVRALLASYGIPLTILNIDEYGGAPATRTDDKRAIEKFNYAVDFSGSAHLQTTHMFIDHDNEALSLTATGSQNRPLSMYEFRIDTSVTESMHLASSDEVAPGAERWVLYLEHSSSAAGNDSPAAISAGSASVYSNYGRLTFYISGSAAQPAVSCSTEYAPFYDNDWWNVSFGFTEHPISGIGNTVELRFAKAAEHSAGRITHSGSVSAEVGTTNMGMWRDTQDIRWGGSGSSGQAGSDFPNLQPFSGSWQEIRGWAEYISDEAFYQHTLAATSIVGDTIQSAYNDLFIRIPLGTDLKRYDVSSPGTTLTFPTMNISGSIPNDSNSEDGYTITVNSSRRPKFIGWQSIPFSAKSETYFVKVPHTAGPSKHSNKVRIEDNTLRNNQLARDKSFEQSSFDSNPLDSEDVSVVLSPADQIDTDIAMQFGGFDLDDYIGDPRDKFKYEYSTLRDTKNLYFKKYTGGNSVMAFVNFLRSFNKGLFKQIEDMIPSRADAIVGIEIRPNLLQRQKLAIPMSASQETLFHTASISVTSTHDLPGSEMVNSQSFFGSDIGMLSAQIGVGAPPSRQRSGSDNYYNLYEGSTYLKDVFGETTESSVQAYVSESRLAPFGRGNRRIKIPTYNRYNKPEYDKAITGSGWTTIVDLDFTNSNLSSSTVNSGDGGEYYYNLNSDFDPVVGNTWFQIHSDPGEMSIANGALTVGNDSGNDQRWLHLRNAFKLEKNALYRMTITVSQSANATDEADDRIYSGFALYSNKHLQNDSTHPAGEGWIQMYSPSTGNPGNSSAAYFVISGLALKNTPGLGKDITLQGSLANHHNTLNFGAINDTDLGGSGLKYIADIGAGPSKGELASNRYTHFSPMILFNYNGDDGIMRLTQYKVEVLPNAFVNVNPNYEYSPAQRRLIIDGTQMQSPDFNVGSSETIDGGPVVEYVLVNPNIVTVDGQMTDSFGNPVSPIGGGNNYTGPNRPSTGGPNTAGPAQQITVR